MLCKRYTLQSSACKAGCCSCMSHKNAGRSQTAISSPAAVRPRQLQIDMLFLFYSLFNVDQLYDVALLDAGRPKA